MRTKILMLSIGMLFFAWGFHVLMMFAKNDFFNQWRISLMGTQAMVCILFYLWQTKGLKDGKDH